MLHVGLEKNYIVCSGILFEEYLYIGLPYTMEETG